MSYMTVGDDTVTNIGKAAAGVLQLYGQANTPAPIVVQAPDSGFPVMPVVLLAGAGLAAWLLLRKK